jgi:tRNA A-37 threonylcarbamoyl transferase component Bud32
VSVVNESYRQFGVYWTNTTVAPELSQIIELINSPKLNRSGPLTGRAQIARAKIQDWGDVIIKQYTRGGVLGKFISDRYLRYGNTRALDEYNFLEEVIKLGVKAPKPLAAIDRGSLFYKAWLVTSAIPQARSLAEIALDNEDESYQYMDEIVRQISILIKNHIFHIDLHPGNVLISGTNEVFLIDFDRAYYAKCGLNDLRDRYIFRWRRAVIKHRLPDSLSESLCHGLRTNYEPN